MMNDGWMMDDDDDDGDGWMGGWMDGWTGWLMMDDMMDEG